MGAVTRSGNCHLYAGISFVVPLFPPLSPCLEIGLACVMRIAGNFSIAFCECPFFDSAWAGRHSLTYHKTESDIDAT